ncbi:MAG: prephenate dehydrogenase, partial [Dokdonia sp.]
MENIYIIGIGLIGGSFAREMRLHKPDAKIYGIDTNKEHMA